MTLKEWVNKFPEKKYNLFTYNKSLQTYTPYLDDYNKLMNQEIEEVHDKLSRIVKLVRGKATVVGKEITYDIYMNLGPKSRKNKIRF